MVFETIVLIFLLIFLVLAKINQVLFYLGLVTFTHDRFIKSVVFLCLNSCFDFHHPMCLYSLWSAWSFDWPDSKCSEAKFCQRPQLTLVEDIGIHVVWVLSRPMLFQNLEFLDSIKKTERHYCYSHQCSEAVLELVLAVYSELDWSFTSVKYVKVRCPIHWLLISPCHLS